MLAVERSGIKSFKSTNFMMAHWGVQMDVGEIFDVIDGGVTEASIYRNFDEYMSKHIPLPKAPDWKQPEGHPDRVRYRKEFDEYENHQRELDKEYRMEIMGSRMPVDGPLPLFYLQPGGRSRRHKLRTTINRI